MKRKIITVFLLLIELFAVAACSNKISIKDTTTNNANQLQIFRTDFNYTQEQALSRIKAEYLKKNNGYKDSDEIITILKLDSESLIETYLDKYANSSDSVSEYVLSNQGISQNNKIIAKQKQLIDYLKTNNLIISVEQQYSTIINAIAVKMTYGNFKNITKVSGISTAILSETYNMPLTTKSSGSAVENVVEVYETGIFDSGSVSYTGNNTSVAVLDSGFDCSHTVFANQPERPMFKQEDISSILDQTNAAKTTEGLKITDVYYSSKIPFIYDYADKDYDVFPYDSEHGTHVAGIIGGKDEVITGVAINTQLVLMKVFPDLDEGAKTEDILAALEDAVVIGVDAINMSLGSSCGFQREVDEVEINRVYDALDASGISVITAASNSYSAGFGGEQGNTNFVTNPDSGTVGSPSTYNACLSVASISGVKSKYMIGNDQDVIFFDESNSITGKPNDFFKELGITEGKTKTYEYVTIPGVGLKVNFNAVGDLTGKIALVRRGDITFEEKAQNAKNAGAAACIIYNNIDGEILMSMGKSDHIPTISISKDNGTILASKDRGTITISYSNQAGPFMSDFSSWGPTPSLGLKPEITAHGGDITSAVPGGGYDQLSGTSMASPNLCGIVVLIRQYIKDTYPQFTGKDLSIFTNQLLMSTATIALNENGNPYSPRKQGAGLASLKNAVNTKAYITVDGSDRTKLELGDDPNRKGVYTMEFNVVNLSNTSVEYNLETIGMTESVSTSDDKHVSEKSQILNGKQKVELVKGGTSTSLNGTTLVVSANDTAKIKVTYTLTIDDKTLIDKLFPYGMYVEGFVKLTAKQDDDIDLNIPFLAFYGDWTEAPMFDKTYYEVDPEKKDASINEDDKLKADYYATIPYGSYHYNYIIPLGTYLYDIDEELYDVIPASEDHIAISNSLGTIDGLATIYAGLLRGAKQMNFVIRDKVTGEIVWEEVDYNCHKAYSQGGTPIPYFNNVEISTYQLGLVNNRQYEFVMNGLLDYGDGGVTNNVRNSFAFDFTFDEEAPIIKNVTYEKEYDKVLKKDRYYMTMVVYDNHYVQSISPIMFTSSSTYTTLTKNPIPVYSERGKDNTVRFEITDYLDDLYEDKLITSALAFAVDDYALNTSLYLCELPGTDGDLKFTNDGSWDSATKLVINIDEGDVVDLTKYLATSDPNVDENKDYLNHLSWESKDASIATVKEGIVVGVKKGRVTITAAEQMNGRNAVIVVNVREKAAALNDLRRNAIKKANQTVEEAEIESLRFSYFDTIAAFAKSAQYSVIGETGSRTFLSSISDLNFYPGEKIQLHYDFNPWYAESNYNLSFHSSNPKVATVDEKTGVVTGESKGTTYITLKVEGSSIQARVKITINDPFIIENRTLVAYKGKGGDVVIPDDEGILYIGSFAFCLYITDRDIKVDEDDWDKNKIPQVNTTITSVVIPEGVEEIQKYAFYNCKNLKTVTLPTTMKFIREFAFDGNENLESINFNKTQVIGRSAFRNCQKLANIDLSKVFAIGISAFEGCSSITTVDLSALRNTGERAFKDCTSLGEVILTEHTKLAKAMFVNTGVVTIDIYEKIQIPEFCFAKCSNLTTVNIHNALVSINEGAFSECPNLINFNMMGSVDIIGNQVFYALTGLERFVLPNSSVELGNYCFYKCSNLTTLVFQANTVLKAVNGILFEETNLTNFEVNENNQHYTVDGSYLTNKDKTEIVLAPINPEYNDLVIDTKYQTIGASAFGGANLNTLTINHNIEIKDFAFLDSKLEKIVITDDVTDVIIGNHVFYQTSVQTISGAEKITEIGRYAFAKSTISNIVLGDNVVVEEGAFYQSSIQSVTTGVNTSFGDGAFQECKELVSVTINGDGFVTLGNGCFGYASKLSSIDLSKINEKIEDETFYGCTSLTEINLANIKYVGAYAFADCESIRVINMPMVVEIGEGAFSKNSENGYAPAFGNVTLPASLTKIGDGAFLGCEGLTEIIIPEGIEKINNYTFAYCLNLANVTLPSTVTELGDYAFGGCQNLVSINLENITRFGDYSVAGTLALESVDLSNGEYFGECAFLNSAINIDLVLNKVIEVGVFAFQKTQIKSFTSSSIEIINLGAFEYNSELETISLSDKITFIDILAFDECPKVSAYQVNGKTSAQIGDYGFVEEGILYRYLANGTYELKSIPGNLQSEVFEIKEGTTRIDDYAGNQNKNIKTLVLPDSLKIIGNYAFYEYDNLEMVEFKSVNAPALEDSYSSSLSVEEGDPGYELVHKYIDLFGSELYYCTFISLAGKREPIKMTIPSNANKDTYATIAYELFFGKVENATISNYIAKEQALKDFIEYAKEVLKIETVTLSDERLVSEAMEAYSMIKQNPSDFGISQTEWNEMVNKVVVASNTIRLFKLSKASQKVKDLQALIDSLPSVPEVKTIESLKPLLENKETTTKIYNDLNKLKASERELIDITRYNELVLAYSIYQELVDNAQTIVEPTPKPNKKGCKCSCGAAVGVMFTIMMASSLTLAIRKKEN